jgi:hypothetical protein
METLQIPMVNPCCYKSFFDNPDDNLKLSSKNRYILLRLALKRFRIPITDFDILLYSMESKERNAELSMHFVDI